VGYWWATANSKTFSFIPPLVSGWVVNGIEQQDTFSKGKIITEGNP